jgi:hypothetical protein
MAGKEGVTQERRIGRVQRFRLRLGHELAVDAQGRARGRMPCDPTRADKEDRSPPSAASGALLHVGDKGERARDRTGPRQVFPANEPLS